MWAKHPPARDNNEQSKNRVSEKGLIRGVKGESTVDPIVRAVTMAVVGYRNKLSLIHTYRLFMQTVGRLSADYLHTVCQLYNSVSRLSASFTRLSADCLPIQFLIQVSNLFCVHTR
ncbi:hypothetical protein J6590_018701 [Homalodisca vitripennis]|nr:hypothetical protein J6590_018701 [Homalodisca vitripennis]